MAFRFKKDPMRKSLIKLLPSDATGGNINSSDIGKMILFSSGKGHLNRPSTNQFALTTADAGYTPVVGILESISESSGADVASTGTYLFVRPIADGEVLEVDYTTETAFWPQANEVLVSTNIGMYLRVCGAGSSSMAGSTATNTPAAPTTDAMSMVQAAYIDVSTVGTVFASSYPFQLVDYSTKYKTVDVIFQKNSTIDKLSAF
jgi:hypothetical protein